MKTSKKILLTAAVFSAAMSFSACDNVASGVYGPPQENWNYETTTETEADTEDFDSETESETGEENSSDTSDTDTENTEEIVSENTDTEEAEQ